MYPWDRLSDADLTALCGSNETVAATDPNCPCLMSGGGPQLNTDVSGPGVRISFYLQALFLALLAARSDSLNEISGALYTLITTNVSMATTSLILGLTPAPEMSLHDAIVVIYLLSGSWSAIFFSLPSYNRFVKSDPTLQTLTIAQSYVIFAFVLAVLVTANTFGTTPRCNSHAIGVVLYHFPASSGRIPAFICLGIIICAYSAINIIDYYCLTMDLYRDHKRRRPKKRQRITKQGANQIAPTTGAAGALILLPKHCPDMECGLVVAGPSHPPLTFLQYTSSTPGTDDKRGAQKTPGCNNKPRKRRAKERYYTKKNAAAVEAVGRGDTVFITDIHGGLVIEIAVIVLLWTMFVMNTELLILWNRFDGGGDGNGLDLWGFGQILPMLLVLLPLVQLVRAFKRLGLKKRKHRPRKHRRGLSAEERATRRAQGCVERHRHMHEHENGSAGANAPSSFKPDWIPPYFPSSPNTRAHLFGNQPSARISANSVHSMTFEPYVKREEQEKEACQRSASVSSCSSISPSSSRTGERPGREEDFEMRDVDAKVVHGN